jgi:hypothetical protein
MSIKKFRLKNFHGRINSKIFGVKYKIDKKKLKLLKFYNNLPNSYNITYCIHHYAKKNIFNYKSITSYVYFLLLVGVNIFLKTDKLADINKISIEQLLSFLPVISYPSFITVYVIFKFFIKIRIKNTGMLSQFILPGIHLLRNAETNPEVLELNFENIDTSQFIFINDEEDVKLCSEINAKAYAKGAWRGTFKRKYERNLRHYRKNKFSLMFIKFEDTDRYVGYTHVFPVSENVWKKYVDGKLGDNSFSYINICDQNPKGINEFPYGLILFSAALIEANPIFFGNKEMHKMYIGDLIEKAIVFHCDILIKNHFSNIEAYKKTEVEVLLQNEGTNYKNFFKGYAEMSKVSKDGGTIIQFKIKNHNIKN